MSSTGLDNIIFPKIRSNFGGERSEALVKRRTALTEN
jgi:hypothetical protein